MARTRTVLALLALLCSCCLLASDGCATEAGPSVALSLSIRVYVDNRASQACTVDTRAQKSTGGMFSWTGTVAANSVATLGPYTCGYNMHRDEYVTVTTYGVVDVDNTGQSTDIISWGEIGDASNCTGAGACAASLQPFLNLEMNDESGVVTGTPAAG